MIRRKFLLNGQIISSKKDGSENNIIKFEQLNIDLSNLTTSTIKTPKLQETSTFKLLNCFIVRNNQLEICNSNAKKEIIPTLNRRIILPLYMIIALICSMLLINSKNYVSISLVFLSIVLFYFCLLITVGIQG